MQLGVDKGVIEGIENDRTTDDEGKRIKLLLATEVRPRSNLRTNCKKSTKIGENRSCGRGLRGAERAPSSEHCKYASTQLRQHC